MNDIFSLFLWYSMVQNSTAMQTITPGLLLLSSSLVQGLPHINRDQTATKGLNWAPCDLDFPPSLQEIISAPIDCATLEVPLDYTSPENGETVELQLVKVNATKEPRKGSVIFNPGGPGASGVEEVAGTGPFYVEYVIFDVCGLVMGHC